MCVVYAARRTGQAGFPSSGFPAHRLIKDCSTACNPQHMPLCTTYLNGPCGHEMNNLEVDLSDIDGNTDPFYTFFLEKKGFPEMNIKNYR